MTDYAARRTMMVDTQVRPSDVTKFPIIDAMLHVPREQFVPSSQREAAYMGDNIELGGGRVILDPRTLAKMLDALDIQQNDLVLDVGCNYGYSSAVIARLAEAVVALESDSGMAGEAQQSLSDANADNVVVQTGELVEGAPEHAPFDVIVVQGGVVRLPDGLLEQLKDQGRIAALFMDEALGEVRIGYKIDDQINWRRAFNAGAPILPGFEKQAVFAF